MSTAEQHRSAEHHNAECDRTTDEWVAACDAYELAHDIGHSRAWMATLRRNVITAYRAMESAAAERTAASAGRRAERDAEQGTG